jgi:hypothetical protein
MRYICHKSWLGGWFLPPKKSYFALQLPMGWWIFGLDLALHGDIDVYQFKFFADLCRNKVLFSFLDHSFSLLWNKFDFNCHCFFVLGGVAHGVLIASILQPHLLAYVLRASPGSWR